MKKYITVYLLMFIGFFNTPLKSMHQNNEWRMSIGKDRVAGAYESFVLSCGSGCAMRYTAEKVQRNLSRITVIFKVEMYLDEQLSDTYDETYIFTYEPSGRIRDVRLKGKNEDVLKAGLPGTQRSFRDFAGELMKKNKKNIGARI
ncbi:hypothetical protein [uncultured Chryseobacterium sp.]|uniref:hypothetical protein n=1 Tax=uncultured Chryseobacterium sp. TaxID=259322 RepID=UPI0025FB2A0B|nr:hypothetical protein [uncultured Chryseobacterium sp.]